MPATLPLGALFGLLGLPGIGVGSLVNAFFSALTSWIGAGAAAIVSAVGGVISETTTPALGAGFSVELRVLEQFGALLAAGFLALVLIEAVLRQDLSLVVRAVFVKLPLALVFSGIAVELVSLGLGASDSWSDALLSAGGAPADHFLTGFAAVLLVTGVAGLPAGFEGFLLAGIAALAAFVLWVELLIRSAAISVAALFIPLALAGVVFPATAHWARRLAETIGALLLSKVVIAGVLALAAATAFDDGGVAGIVEGIALFLFAVLSPFALLRLVPALEQGAALSLEEAGQLATRTGRRLASTLTSLGAGGATATAGPGPSVVEGVGYFEGTPFGGPEFEADVARVEAAIGGGRLDGTGGADTPSSGPSGTPPPPDWPGEPSPSAGDRSGE